jgi:predicted Zn-dependent protease
MEEKGQQKRKFKFSTIANIICLGFGSSTVLLILYAIKLISGQFTASQISNQEMTERIALLEKQIEYQESRQRELNQKQEEMAETITVLKSDFLSGTAAVRRDIQRINGLIQQVSVGPASIAERKVTGDLLVVKGLQDGHTAFSKGNYKEAESAFQEVVSLDPQNKEALLYQTISAYYMRKGNLHQMRDTRAVLQTLYLEDTQNKVIVEVLADIEGEEGNWGEAANLYKKRFILGGAGLV